MVRLVRLVIEASEAGGTEVEEERVKDPQCITAKLEKWDWYYMYLHVLFYTCMLCIHNSRVHIIATCTMCMCSRLDVGMWVVNLPFSSGPGCRQHSSQSARTASSC